MTRAEQRQFGRRRLRLETLETRRVLAGDILMQNAANPEDVNHDGYATAQDALIVINDLNGEGGSDPLAFSADVNGDGVVSPGDALYIINAVNSGSQRSGVPVATRIHNLQTALAEGKVPHRMTLGAAHEILETLRNGGLPELGDRFRNGKMINLKDLAEQLADTGPKVDATEPAPIPESSTSVSEPGPIETESESTAPEELLDLEVALEDEAPGAVDWWNDVVDDLSAFDDGSMDAYVRPWLVDGLQSIRNDSSLSERLNQEQLDYWIMSLQNNESVPMDILLELEAYRSTLGDLKDRIAQMFANFDVEAIMEYLPNFDIMVEAITPEYSKPEHEAEYEAAMAEWVTGDLFSLSF